MSETPDLTFEQKAFRTVIGLRFWPARLDYAVINGKGEKASFSVAYEDLPARGDYKNIKPQLSLVTGQGIVLTFMTIALLAAFPEAAGEVLLNMAALSLLLVAATLMLQRKFLQRSFTALPMRENILLVLQDGQHDKIIAEIESRRRLGLKKLARIEPGKPVPAELKKFAWLRGQGVITDAEFAHFRARLLGHSERHGTIITPDLPPENVRPPDATLH